jgi:hypothetical protein
MIVGGRSNVAPESARLATIDVREVGARTSFRVRVVC